MTIVGSTPCVLRTGPRCGLTLSSCRTGVRGSRNLRRQHAGSQAGRSRIATPPQRWRDPAGRQLGALRARLLQASARHVLPARAGSPGALLGRGWSRRAPRRREDDHAICPACPPRSTPSAARALRGGGPGEDPLSDARRRAQARRRLGDREHSSRELAAMILGTKPAPMPWMKCGPTRPAQRRGVAGLRRRSSAPTAFFSFRNSPAGDGAAGAHAADHGVHGALGVLPDSGPVVARARRGWGVLNAGHNRARRLAHILRARSRPRASACRRCEPRPRRRAAARPLRAHRLRHWSAPGGSLAAATMARRCRCCRWWAR